MNVCMCSGILKSGKCCDCGAVYEKKDGRWRLVMAFDDDAAITFFNQLRGV